MPPRTGAWVQAERMGPVAVLALCPDARAVAAGASGGLLDGGMRRALWQALADAAADAAVQAVLLIAQGAAFPSGDELAALAVPLPGRVAPGPDDAPTLAELCARIEDFAVPVVVALHGAVAGGGVDLALACHYRIGRADLRLALPLRWAGLVPQGGATQRLPRLIGPGQALRLLLEGAAIGAAEALALGLLDAVAEPETLAAVAWRLAEGQAGRPPRRSRAAGGRWLADARGWMAAVAAARAAQPVQDAAAARILACVDLALLLPFDQGLVCEAEAFADLAALPQAPGLAHALRLEQMAGAAAVAPPARLGVVGAGLADLALAALEAGLTVVLADPQRPRLVQALERIAALQEQAVAAGSLTAAQREADWARLIPALGYAALADCGAVLLAGVEPAAEVALCAAGVPLVLAAPGPAVLPPLAGGAQPAGLRLAAGHLAEVLQAPDTPPAAVQAAQGIALALGFLPVVLPAPGGIAQRLAAAGRAAVAHLPGGLQVAAGLAGRGFGALLPAGLTPAQPMEGDDSFARVAAAMANAGARMLDRGQAPDAATIDLVALAAGLFPRSEGGPMFWADRRGALILRRELEIWAKDAPAVWTIAPLLDRLARRGGRLADQASRMPETTSISPSAETPSAPMFRSTTF